MPDFTSLLSQHHRTFASLSVQRHPQQIWHLIIPCSPLTYLPSFPVVNVSRFTSVFTACYGLFHLFTYSTYLAPTSQWANKLHHSLQCPAIWRCDPSPLHLGSPPQLAPLTLQVSLQWNLSILFSANWMEINAWPQSLESSQLIISSTTNYVCILKFP